MLESDIIPSETQGHCAEDLYVRNRPHILIGCTGSVASLKIPELTRRLLSLDCQPEVQVVSTEHALHFFNISELPPTVTLYRDQDEWTAWSSRGDPVLHIDLRRWADVYVLAPLDANTLAKVASGLCDNLLTCVARAWDVRRPLLFAPAMNTAMYNHPCTASHIASLREYGYEEIGSIEKELVCGDRGVGAMAEVTTIVDRVKHSMDRIIASGLHATQTS